LGKRGGITSPLNYWGRALLKKAAERKRVFGERSSTKGPGRKSPRRTKNSSGGGENRGKEEVF